MSKLPDLTDLVERMEPLEGRLNITIQGLYADIEYNQFIRVNGELHTTSGLELAEDISLVLIVYDSQGRVIATTNSQFDSDSFQMFEVFSLSVDTHGTKATKIRLYPKKN